MENAYTHTQYGLLTFILFLLTGIVILFVALAVIGEGRVISALLMACFYLLGLGMFYSFTIEISGEQLKFWFGIRIVQKSIELREIHSTKEIVNPWYYFWGVKSIPGGWFYAIAPGPAVEIELTNGRIVQIGTNQPQELKKAIDNARLIVG